MAKGNNAREGIIRQQQIELVCKYRARSYSFRQIADMVSTETGVKITHVTAFNDYMKALEEAKKRAENTAVYSLIVEIEKLDRLENQYWIGWDKSMGALSKKKISKKKENTVQEAEEREQNGEVAFLNGIRQCIETRCRLLGIMSTKVDIAEVQSVVIKKNYD